MVEMSPRFEPLSSRAEAYRYDGDGVSDIRINLDDERLNRVKLINPNISQAYCEYIAAGLDYYTELVRHSGFLIHASAVVKDGRAYLFSAACGTGKSTHTQLWLQAFKDAFILNDDKPAIRLIDGRAYAFGTPFSGKHDLSRNVRVPLQAIAFLEQAKSNSIERITNVASALRRILDQTIRPLSDEGGIRILDYMDALIKEAPIYLLKCNTSPSAALTAYEGMRPHE
ncbi:MAG: hypothetical protein Q4C04_07725 [Clostridia bacterium]|nr:hypothetical protein [Clostridia bacterium]